MQDCSAAVQNLLLAARAIGLGAVWTSVYPDQIRVAEFRRLFRLPEHIIPFAIVPIGYSGVEQKRVDRYTDEFVHDNMW